jgi:hypothetical protein
MVDISNVTNTFKPAKSRSSYEQVPSPPHTGTVGEIKRALKNAQINVDLSGFEMPDDSYVVIQTFALEVLYRHFAEIDEKMTRTTGVAKELHESVHHYIVAADVLKNVLDQAKADGYEVYKSKRAPYMLFTLSKEDKTFYVKFSAERVRFEAGMISNMDLFLKMDNRSAEETNGKPFLLLQKLTIAQKDLDVVNRWLDVANRQYGSELIAAEVSPFVTWRVFPEKP